MLLKPSLWLGKFLSIFHGYILLYTYIAILLFYIAHHTCTHVGDVDSLDLCEDSNLDSPGEESSSDMQFTDASSSDAVSELNDSLYVPTPERRLKIKLKRVESRKVAFMDLAEHEIFSTRVQDTQLYWKINSCRIEKCGTGRFRCNVNCIPQMYSDVC